MDLTVRAASDADIGAIADLLGELGYPLDEGEVVARLRAATSNQHFVLVAVAGERVVGVVSAGVVPMLAEASMMVRITALSVTATARGQGIGRALVEAVEERARQRRAAVVEVGSGRRPERAAAHHFYPALGFRDANATAARYWKWLDTIDA